MSTQRALYLVILIIGVSSTIDDNEINPLDEAKAAILQEQDLQNIGGMLNSVLQSDGAKNIGNMLMNAAAADGGGQLLQGIGAAMSLLQPAASNKDKQGDSGIDPSLIFSLLGNLMGGQNNNNNNNFMSYLPLIMQTINAFAGPEAEERAKAHSGHATMLPPFMEKIHLWFDHFMNTDIAKQMMETLGATKYVKVFADERGHYSYKKMVDMMENHSFRKHWLTMITKKITQMISYFSDTKIQKKYAITIQHFVNSALKSQGYPKSVQIDFGRPVESISAVINKVVKDHLSIKVDSKPYVKPAVKYVQELLSLANKRSMINVDQRQMSDKLADTINMEIIEPFAKVNRAYRFAMKVPECDKYVMCLVNQEPSNEVASLPGLRPLLSKTASLILSWFLSSHSGSPYLTLYSVINAENDCQKYYMSKCNDFHVEEVRVTTEYVHNEL